VELPVLPSEKNTGIFLVEEEDLDMGEEEVSAFG
jgi:hypothetical protein